MLCTLLGTSSGSVLLLIGLLFTFAATALAIHFGKQKLPKDIGRDFAFDGKLSAGKPESAGLYFVLAFVAAVLLFVPLSLEIVFDLIIIILTMFSGYFDDASSKPWNEYKKGLIDVALAVMVAVNFLYFHPAEITLGLFGVSFTIPKVIFGILTVILVWASINVTNCSDGVDGLSATLSIITLGTIALILQKVSPDSSFISILLLFIMALISYLWFNATPSIVLMGDAGSRPMGLIIAVAILQTGRPLLYFLVAIVLILDGGLGLIKVSLKRFLKICILVHTRTPLHDEARKVRGWSNTQTVFRFAIVQILFSTLVLCLVK